MTSSNLTSSEAEMLASIANSYGASPTVSALTHSKAAIIGAWYSAVVGGSSPHRTKTAAEMLAAIRSALVSGITKSHLHSNVAELLADIATVVQGSTVSAARTPIGAALAIITYGGGSDVTFAALIVE